MRVAATRGLPLVVLGVLVAALLLPAVADVASTSPSEAGPWTSPHAIDAESVGRADVARDCGELTATDGGSDARGHPGLASHDESRLDDTTPHVPEPLLRGFDRSERAACSLTAPDVADQRGRSPPFAPLRGLIDAVA